MIILILLFSAPLQAKPRYFFKIASLAPEGSIWITNFRDFAKEVEDKTEGNVTIKTYPGGVMGDDLAMYRKIRAGQLHGGGFTMTGISNVVPDFRVMAIPLLVSTYQQVQAVTQKLRPYFEQKFNEKGLELIAITEVGFIYPMSTAPTATIADLQKRKSWVPAEDPLTAAFLQNLGVNPIPLSIPDVLSSLQTGLIDTVYASLYGTIVMQWFSKAQYITDMPYGYAYGAIAFSKKTYSELPEDYAAIVRAAADHHFTTLNQKTRQLNEESRKVLEEYGVTFIPASPVDIAKLHATRDATIKELQGSAFSEEAFSQVAEVLEQVQPSRQ